MQCSKKYMGIWAMPVGKLYKSKESYFKNYVKNYYYKKLKIRKNKKIGGTFIILQKT